MSLELDYNSDVPLTTGQIINNRYRIVRLLGEGGFGAVYRARDTNVNEPVALKESLDISPEAVRQFQVEARILFKLRHPHLPVVHDVFLIPNQGQYLVMDYIEGEDLEAKVAGACLPEQQCIRWVLQICEALEYLHSQSPPIIHRDIKPANIRINSLGQAILVDFGLAKVYNPLLRTTQGARAVTPGYSPIEQYGQAATDPRSDVYALGATFYTLLTGEVPPESVLRSAGTELPLPRTLNPQISLTSEACILSAMALKREDRPQTIAQFRHALTTPSAQAGTDPLVPPVIRAEPVELHTPPPAVHPMSDVPSKPASKRKANWTWAILIILLLAFATAGAGLWLRSTNQKAAATAQLRTTDAADLQTATQEESALLSSPASQTALPQPTQQARLM